MITDSHCHLDHFREDEQPEIIARAIAAGVTRMVTIGTRVTQAATVKAIAERFAPHVWCTVGVHPHQAGEPPMPTVEEIIALTDHPRVVGIGESGLDYFYDKSPRPTQQEGFRRHIRAARATGLPLCIHARDADEDMAAILREEHAAGAFPFLLHCFSSGRALAEAALELGGYISLSGILTFPKSEELRAIAADVPADRLLVETDSPFLAPVPLRGKRCEPAYTAHTVAVLAKVKSMPVAEMARITSQNFERLYPRVSGSGP